MDYMIRTGMYAVPGTDYSHREIGVWAVTLYTKSHKLKPLHETKIKYHAHIILHNDILSVSVPWLCSFAKQKYHYGQQCRYDSPPLAISNTSHSFLWPWSTPASTSASSANYSLNVGLHNIFSVCAHYTELAVCIATGHEGLGGTD